MEQLRLAGTSESHPAGSRVPRTQGARATNPSSQDNHQLHCSALTGCQTSLRPMDQPGWRNLSFFLLHLEGLWLLSELDLECLITKMKNDSVGGSMTKK